ncbi:unnamed protein product [Effrenium voratum]|uniref:Uncharacterized protein n=1 Tax=Effrenium voratum TaxID=2562239 RepID=A0AA36N7L1_9DINO|nr:unnamed protein product [Effrenium voratum]
MASKAPLLEGKKGGHSKASIFYGDHEIAALKNLLPGDNDANAAGVAQSLKTNRLFPTANKQYMWNVLTAILVTQVLMVCEYCAALATFPEHWWTCTLCFGIPFSYIAIQNIYIDHDVMHGATFPVYEWQKFLTHPFADFFSLPWEEFHYALQQWAGPMGPNWYKYLLTVPWIPIIHFFGLNDTGSALCPGSCRRVLFARIGYSAAWMFITNFTHSLPWNEFLANDPGRTWPVLHNMMALILGGKHRWNEMLFHDVHHAFPNAVGTLSQRGRFHGWEKVHDAAAEVLHRGLWKANGDEETQMQKTQKKRSMMMKQGKFKASLEFSVMASTLLEGKKGGHSKDFYGADEYLEDHEIAALKNLLPGDNDANAAGVAQSQDKMLKVEKNSENRYMWNVLTAIFVTQVLMVCEYCAALATFPEHWWTCTLCFGIPFSYIAIQNIYIDHDVMHGATFPVYEWQKFLTHPFADFFSLPWEEFVLEHNRHHASTVDLMIQGEFGWDPEEFHYALQQWAGPMGPNWYKYLLTVPWIPIIHFFGLNDTGSLFALEWWMHFPDEGTGGKCNKEFWSKWVPRRVKHNAFVLSLWACASQRGLEVHVRRVLLCPHRLLSGLDVHHQLHPSLPWNEFLANDPGRTWPVLHNMMALILGGKHRWNEMLFHDVHHAFPNAVGTLSQRGRFHGWEKVHDAAAEVLHRGLWKANGDEETQMQKTQKKRSMMMKQGK